MTPASRADDPCARAVTTSLPPSWTTNRIRTTMTGTTGLPALIYGWDDAADEDTSDNAAAAGGRTTMTPFDTGPHECSPTGIAVAETLNMDANRVGSLARLAVAFTPPEQSLELDQIEKVDVICVENDHIDIQAIICEDGGCVSLAVPVRFPYSCDDGGLHGCVIEHLDELDTSAQSTLKQKQSHGGEGLDEPIAEFPSWWVHPSFMLETECMSMRSILNEAEFQADIHALAQNTLNRLKGADAYQLQNARVATIGPAGIAIKAQAQAGGSSVVVDVMYAFSEPMQDAQALRAAILGAVAMAEG